jgi:hypothetical protein
MTKKDFENFLTSSNSAFYRFSYVLIPDDLQATQIVADAVLAATCENRDFPKRVKELNRVDVAPLLEEFKTSVYRYIYTIGQKRSVQLKDSLTVSIDSSFFTMNIDERAIVYLKHKEDFGISKISEILDLPIEKVISRLNLGRSVIAFAHGVNIAPLQPVIY